MNVCGIDEAGRGPAIGPLVIACVTLDEESKKRLGRHGIRDSKKIAPKKRETLEKQVKKDALEWKLTRISARDIDRLRKRMSLNDIEAMRTARLICSLKIRPERIIVDAADPIQERYGQRITRFMAEIDPSYEPVIISEHKADDNYIEVGAASILAKVERDRVIRGLAKKYGNIGSGYPSDMLTQEFIKKVIKNRDCPDCVRRSWSTFDTNKQSSITDY